MHNSFPSSEWGRPLLEMCWYYLYGHLTNSFRPGDPPLGTTPFKKGFPQCMIVETRRLEVICLFIETVTNYFRFWPALTKRLWLVNCTSGSLHSYIHRILIWFTRIAHDEDGVAWSIRLWQSTFPAKSEAICWICEKTYTPGINIFPPTENNSHQSWIPQELSAGRIGILQPAQSSCSPWRRTLANFL